MVVLGNAVIGHDDMPVLTHLFVCLLVSTKWLHHVVPKMDGCGTAMIIIVVGGGGGDGHDHPFVHPNCHDRMQSACKWSVQYWKWSPSAIVTIVQGPFGESVN